MALSHTQEEQEQLNLDLYLDTFMSVKQIVIIISRLKYNLDHTLFPVWNCVFIVLVFFFVCLFVSVITKPRYIHFCQLTLTQTQTKKKQNKKQQQNMVAVDKHEKYYFKGY